MTFGRYIVGLGTGRCGTASLAVLLSLQMGVLVAHERRPILAWNGETVPNRHLTPHVAATVADVGFYYLPHVPRLVEIYGDAIRFVCLERPCEETVASFLANGDAAWFSGEVGEWGRAFPTYEGLGFADAVRTYWHDYNRSATRYCREWPQQFAIFPTDALNTYEGVAAILRHAGVGVPNVQTKIHVTHG